MWDFVAPSNSVSEKEPFPHFSIVLFFFFEGAGQIFGVKNEKSIRVSVHVREIQGNKAT